MNISRGFKHAFIASVLILSAVSLVPAYASGPGEGGRRVRLEDEPAGPYLLRVVTSPTPPKVENYNVEVRVRDAQSGKVLNDVTVLITAEPAETEGEEISEVATHDFAPIPNEYAAHLLVYQEGLWNITVRVEGDFGDGEVTYVERITNPVDLGWLVAFGPPVAGMVLLILVFLRLQRNAQRSREGNLEDTASE
jgi:hypothetical protein